MLLRCHNISQAASMHYYARLRFIIIRGPSPQLEKCDGCWLRPAWRLLLILASVGLINWLSRLLHGLTRGGFPSTRPKTFTEYSWGQVFPTSTGRNCYQASAC